MLRRHGWPGPAGRAYVALAARRCPHARWVADRATLQTMLARADVTVRAGGRPVALVPRRSAAETVRRYLALPSDASCGMLSSYLLAKVYGAGDALAACRREESGPGRRGPVVITGVRFAGDTAVVTFDLPGEAAFGNSQLLVREGGAWKIDGPRPAAGP